MNALLVLFRVARFAPGLLLASELAAQAPAPAPASAAPPVEVRTALPQPITADAVTEAPGRTEPIESARIFTRATGIVRERRVDIGDRVAAGDVLALGVGAATGGAACCSRSRSSQNASRCRCACHCPSDRAGIMARWLGTTVVASNSRAWASWVRIAARSGRAYPLRSSP